MNQEGHDSNIMGRKLSETDRVITFGLGTPLGEEDLEMSGSNVELEEVKARHRKGVTGNPVVGGEMGCCTKTKGLNGGIKFEEGRKSVSHLEMNVAYASAFLQVKVMAADMPEFMQLHAFQCARRAFDSLDKFSSRQVAHDIKKEFDEAYGPVWHCIVGASFGSYVTHSKGCFLYFSMEKILIMVFKTRAPRLLD